MELTRARQTSMLEGRSCETIQTLSSSEMKTKLKSSLEIVECHEIEEEMDRDRSLSELNYDMARVVSEVSQRECGMTVDFEGQD